MCSKYNDEESNDGIVGKSVLGLAYGKDNTVVFLVAAGVITDSEKEERVDQVISHHVMRESWTVSWV